MNISGFQFSDQALLGIINGTREPGVRYTLPGNEDYYFIQREGVVKAFRVVDGVSCSCPREHMDFDRRDKMLQQPVLEHVYNEMGLVFRRSDFLPGAMINYYFTEQDAFFKFVWCPVRDNHLIKCWVDPYHFRWQGTNDPANVPTVNDA